MQYIIALSQKIPFVILILLSALSTITADYYAKLWSFDHKWPYFIIGIIGYFLSGVFYMPVLLKQGLIVTALIWTLTAVIGFLFIGLIVFKEQLNSWQIIGVIFGIIALITLSISLK